MDTKKLRELAETLDALDGSVARIVFVAGKEAAGKEAAGVKAVFVEIPHDKPNILARLKDALNAGLGSAKKEIESQIRREVNRGEIVRDPVHDLLKQRRVVDDYLKGPSFEEAIKGPTCK